MTTRAKARKIIGLLERRGFYADCPSCEETIKLKDSGLFYLDEFSPEAKKVYEELIGGQQQRGTDLKRMRKNISLTSETGARAVNIGFILERLAPAMCAFRFDRNDCRSLFDPIDYLIFEGLSKKGTVSRILFTDIKTGGSPLKASQKAIRSLVESKKVSLLTYKSGEQK